ncbi:hypothetical protein IG197_05110 [Aminobacter sp. SR38]|jgi:hypothetical protein|uniref:hypothetical protein n=1 Tax=Aminobacter sp. SR38 TaxID=2774562 RepID=UPI00177F2E76|nr:hypothetical protein [Aminobacter sp. SR38]QOF72459.1 hypothetical protein IG197_05110 [Aminobacter sp. SR38]
MNGEGTPRFGFDLDGMANFFQDSPFGFGGGDIFSCGPFGLLEHVANMVFILSMVEDVNGRNPISEFVVVLPPDSEHTVEDVRTAFANAVAVHRGRPLDVQERQVLARRLGIAHAANLQVDAVTEIVERARRNSVLILCAGAKYRDEALELPDAKPGRLGLEEDLWVPHFHSLAAKAIAAAGQNELYVALHTGKWRPHRKANTDLLLSVENCGLLTAENDQDIDGVLVENGERWFADIEAGRIGSVLAAIDVLPDGFRHHKTGLKIQMLHRAGLAPQAVALIREDLRSGADPSPEGRVKLAMIAVEAGAHDLAVELLNTAIGDLASEDMLEAAVTLAYDLGKKELELESVAMLERMFPGSHYLQRHRLQLLLQARDYAGVTAMLAAPPPGIDPEAAAYHLQLAAALAGADKHGYEAVLAEVADRWPGRLVQARLACIRDADARGLFSEALALAMALELTGEHAQRSAWALLHAVEQLLIRRDQHGGLGIDPADLDLPVNALLGYLASSPADGETRQALAKLLSVKVTGTYGLPMIAAATLKLVQAAPAPTSNSTGLRARGQADYEESLMPFLKSALQWLADQGVVVLGRTTLPGPLLNGQADALMLGLSGLIERVSQGLRDGSDIDYIQKLLAIAVATAPHTSTPNIDLVLIRLVGGAYVTAGRVQHARDLAEHGLQVAGGEPLRSRIAWYGFADIYHRLHNLTEALIGMACALSCEAPVGPEEVWYETHGLIRLLRDLNMTAFARSLLPTAKELFRTMGVEKSQGHRLDTIELGLRFRELMRTIPSPEDVTEIVAALVANCQTVIDRRDELAPVSILLAQAIRMAEVNGITVPEKTRERLEVALATLGEPNASMVRTLSAGGPVAKDVLSFAKRLEPARHSEDAAYDVRPVAMAARRLLDSGEAVEDAKIAAFAIELLADQAIKRQSVSGSGLPSSIDEPANIAKEISRAGISVILLGVADSNRVVRVTAEGGELSATIHEPADVFSKAAFDTWGEQYPYRYGFDSDDPNIFYNSMRGLGIGAAPTTRALLVADVSLQQLPANLLMASGEFLGLQVPVAAAPSLSWLREARTRPARTGAPFAWIPIADDPEAIQTLGVLADRLSGTLRDHSIGLDTGLAIPEGLSGAELAIVTAHGSIIPEGRFFQVVADDADMRLTPDALSTAARNAGVVILFVCSAGRFDKHPMADTTTGLAKELLDQGCSVVIASPWPLNASVPAYWLPAFMEAWSVGATVTDANFEGNKAVERALGNSTANCLALTVFGDPLVTKRRETEPA